MTYKINKTDGSLLAEVVDSTVDQSASDLTLIGKNVSGFGEYINENFIKFFDLLPLGPHLWQQCCIYRLE